MLLDLYKEVAKRSKLDEQVVAKSLRGLGMVIGSHSFDQLMGFTLNEWSTQIKNSVDPNDQVSIGDVIKVLEVTFELMKGQKVASVLISLDRLIQVAEQSTAEGQDLPASKKPAAAPAGRR